MARVLVGSVLVAAAAAPVPLLVSACLLGGGEAHEMAASYAAVGDRTRTPYGWVDFCGRQPKECLVDVRKPMDLRLTKKTAAVLARVNAEVNIEIEPMSNLEHWGTMLDHWDYPTDGKGDCKIYALWKRKLLMDIGFPRQALLMTIVRDLQGNGHTVLTVKTDHGDLILDNMVGEIRPWNATGYTFVKRQSQRDPNVWVSVGPTNRDKVLADVRSGPPEKAGPTFGLSKRVDADGPLLSGRSVYQSPPPRRSFGQRP